MSLFDDMINTMSKAGNSTQTGGAAPAMQVAGTLLNAIGQSQQGASIVEQGKQQYQASQYQVDQLAQNANAAIAASQRSAQNQQQQTDYLISKAIAIAASGGGGVQDPTVVNTVARIAGESAYRQSVALYGGQEQARTDTMQASAKEVEGEAALQASKSAGRASILKTSAGLMGGASSLYTRFGMNGPKMNQGAGDGNAS